MLGEEHYAKMPLVFAAIMPHGGEIIPELAEDPSVMAHTRTGMISIGRTFVTADIDTVIVITPHGHVYQDVITVSCCKSAAGALDGPRGERIGASFTVDTDLANALLNHPTLPLVGLTTGDDSTAFPLDWGALIPLLFTADTNESACKVVVIAEDRGMSRDVLVAAGRHIADVAEASDKRIALIVSCDLGHAHLANGPYGYAPASKVHDESFVQVVSENRLESLLDWDEAFLDDAKVDAYWQTLMLYGALTVVPMSVRFYTYEAPTYFGMLTASYLRL